MKLSKLKNNPNNPRILKDDKFKKLVKSIKEFPKMMELRPMVIDKNNIVLGGNMRLKALKELGYKDIPDNWVKRADELTEAEKERFIIADNVGFGVWDWDELNENWDENNLIDWGLDIPEFDAEILEAKEDDYQEPETMQVDIIKGDLVEFICDDGRAHRLLCGDSTCSDSVAKLMNGKKAELLFTSPPYSDMRDYNGNKDLSIDNLAEFIPTFMPHVNFQVVNLGIQRKDNEIVQYWDKYIEVAKACGLKFLSWNVWKKPNAGSISNQTALFPINIEWIFVFGGKKKKINATRKTKTGGMTKGRQYKNKQGETIQRGKAKRNYLAPIYACIDITQEGKPFGNHPAPFPIELPSEYIKAMTNKNQIVVEPFTGSGSTMVAAHQLNRTCYGMELDEKYCQVIIDRMIKLDETLTIKINGKEYKKEAQNVPF